MMARCMFVVFFVKIVVVISFDRNVNVGTTLFSQDDLHKANWSATEFGLLKARWYFQDLLPSGNFIDTANEAYVNKLFKYFRDAYSTIKRQTPNETTNKVMTIAFSDAVGGYLKFWALPVTKLGFYGGTVSQNNIMKLSRLYHELKQFLETNGDGWRSPERNLLRNMTLNVAPPPHLRRNMKNPCKDIILEEGPYGLIIPIPNVHWEDRSSTIFIPVKKDSIIPLESPDYPNALVQYYDNARTCIEENKSDELNDFDERFQLWLVNEIMPHLYDEKVYLALGNVLSLVNKTRDFSKYDHIKTRKVIIGGVPIDFSSKKTLFVIILLILEMVWCIPALIYLACSRRKTKKCVCQGSERICSTDSTDDTHATNITTKILSNFINGLTKKKRCFKYTESSNTFPKGLKLEQKPRTDIINFESVSTQPETKSSATSKAAVNFEREGKNVSLKSSMRKIYNSHTSRSQYNVSVTPGKSKLSLASAKICTCSKCTINDSFHNGDSFVVVKTPVGSNIHTVVEAVSESTNVISRSDTYTLKMDDSNNTLDNISIIKSSQDLEKACPCYPCMKNESESHVTILNQEKQSNEITLEKNSDANTQVHIPLVKETMNHGVKIDSGFEIMIEKPRTEISVGIKGIFDNRHTAKPSKIPKRLPTTVAVKLTCKSSSKKDSQPTSTMKSLIPQRKRLPADDMDILRKTENSKLNKTL